MKRYFLLCLGIIIFCTGCFHKSISSDIEFLVKSQENFIHQKNMKKYMETISKEESEYISEKKSWMRDIQNNSIKNYKLHIKEINKMSSDEVIATIEQTYEINKRKYILVYPIVFKKEKNQWKDHDIYFEKLYTRHFQIKYPKGLKNHANMIAKACEKAYINVFERYGEKAYDTTMIKLYEDQETLRQSVKLSFPWNFAGWYEYPESIKTTKLESEDVYREVIEHELMHKLTIKKSNNNIPYWFTEGMSVYFCDFFNEPYRIHTKDDYFKVYKKEMSILEIENTNLEKLTKEKDISKYYDTAGLIISFMIEKYGIDQVKDIIKALGEFSYIEGTGEEIDHIAVKRFHKVLPKVLGISIEELNREWIVFLHKTE